MARALASVLIKSECYTGSSVSADVEAFVSAPDITFDAECATVFEMAGRDVGAFLRARATGVGKVVSAPHLVIP